MMGFMMLELGFTGHCLHVKCAGNRDFPTREGE